MTGEKRNSPQQQPLGASSDDASTSSGPPKRHQKEQKDAGMTTQARSRMSQALLSSLVNRFGDELSQGANSWLLCVPDQAEWVENQCQWMQAFLKDAEDKSDTDERVKQWIWEVRKLEYLAEDTIDTCWLEIERSTDSNQIIVACRKLVSAIERMKDNIWSILDSRVAYGIKDILHEEGMSTSSRSGRDRRLLSPRVKEPHFVGFQADLEELMQRLTKGEPQCSVISIVGIGGQGKTTLAGELYESEAAGMDFDFYEWISVSQVYEVAKLLRDVVVKWKGPSAEGMDADELRHEIAQHLKEKKYLVILDDVRTREAWDDLKDAFPNMSNGSRVLLTTRKEDIALHADPCSKPYKMRGLDEDESWKLFLKKALSGCKERQKEILCNSPMDWEETRIEILSKCRGLPLAIAVVGGLLSGKDGRNWQNILKSISWQLIEGEDRISGILSLSYRDLPHHLKQCFLYLGVFPKGKTISYKKLIRLWVAEGFLQERGVLTLEEAGEECVCELVRRNLIEVFESSKGSIKSCRIHDRIRDFILLKAEEDAFLVVQSSIAASKTYEGRRLAIDNEKSFLNLYNRDGVESVGLDEEASRLGVERRQIYDIVNVLESVGVLARKAKNRYSWKGFGGIPQALAELKEDAMRESNDVTSRKLHDDSKDFDDEEGEKSPDPSCEGREEKLSPSTLADNPSSSHISGKMKADNRREKSLGLLTQNFVKLFLMMNSDTISLDEAANLLLGDDSSQMRNNSAAKVRRLYDIANVLSSMNLIEKTQQTDTRKPAFRWVGIERKTVDTAAVSTKPLHPEQSMKREFGTEISNIDFKRSRLNSETNEKPIKMQMKYDDLPAERNCVQLQEKEQSSKGFVFGPFRPVGLQESQKVGKRIQDWESLASSFRPQYHNQALSDLFAHYMEAWKSWYVEVSQGSSNHQTRKAIHQHS